MCESDKIKWKTCKHTYEKSWRFLLIFVVKLELKPICCVESSVYLKLTRIVRRHRIFFYHILRLNLARIRFEINHWIKSYDVCVSKDIKLTMQRQRQTHMHAEKWHVEWQIEWEGEREKCKHWNVSFVYFEIMANFSWDRFREKNGRNSVVDGISKLTLMCRCVGSKVFFCT